jgi:hypothetical protein
VFKKGEHIMIERLIPVAAAATNTGESATNVRDATAGFQDPAAALAAGYDLLTDAADIACIDQRGAGAMGMLYVKGSRVWSRNRDRMTLRSSTGLRGCPNP